MAPEFIPLCGLALLVTFSIVLAVTATVSFFASRRSQGRMVLPQWLFILLVGVCVPVVVLTVSLGTHVRQQYLLNEPLASAASDGDVTTVTRLLSKGGSPDSYGIDFVSTALIGAVEGEHADVVRELLDAGADPNLADSRGKSPLQAARETGNLQIERLLLDAGADEDRSSKGLEP